MTRSQRRINMSNQAKQGSVHDTWPPDRLKGTSADSINVLILGRTGRRSGGGIGRSCKMIADALTEAGDVCRIRSVKSLLTDIPSDTDLIWHYGDITHIDQQVRAAREAGVPMLVNSTYDGLPDRRRQMIEQMNKWSSEDPLSNIFLGVFSHEAENDPRLSKIKGRLMAVPKTINVGSMSPVCLGWKPRSGICLGEFEKLNRSRLVKGIDVAAAVDEIRRRIPGVKLYAYDQYSTPGTPAIDGVEVVKLFDKGDVAFRSFLERVRLFVSLVQHETFAMVPAEAQSVGTPVMYRHMSQSLSSHIGFSGVIYDTVDELAEMAALLYGNERRWFQMSRSGIDNARARGVRNVAAPLSMALRRLLIRCDRSGGSR